MQTAFDTFFLINQKHLDMTEGTGTYFVCEFLKYSEF